MLLLFTSTSPEINSNSVKKSSLAAFLLFQWLESAIDLRQKCVAERKAKKLEEEEAEPEPEDQADEDSEAL